jgi:hypothetical protein
MSGIKFGEVEKPTTPIDNIVIIASGPSVNNINLEHLRWVDNKFVITINDAGKHINFADAWFTLDPWGLQGPQLPTGNPCKLYAAVPQDYGTPNARIAQHRATPSAKITYLHRLISHNDPSVSSETAYKLGLSDDPSCISTGNSGYGALNLAYHMRPKNIYLLGIDGTNSYFYEKKTTKPLTYLPQMFKSSVSQLTKANVKVYNVSPQSVVTCFQKLTPQEFQEKLC